MAEISTQTALEIERARSSTVNWLRNLGYNISVNAEWDDIQAITQNMTANSVAQGLVTGTFNGFYIDNGATNLRNRAFNGCTAMQGVEMPNITSAGQYVFEGVGSSFIRPLVLGVVGGRTMQDSTCVVPLIILNGTVGLYGTGRTPIVDAQGDRNLTIDNTTFYNSGGLRTLILRSSHIANLSSSSSMPSNVQEIYVPHDLVNSYKTATNWSTIESKIKDIQGSDYESLTWYEGWTLQTP